MNFMNQLYLQFFCNIRMISYIIFIADDLSINYAHVWHAKVLYDSDKTKKNLPVSIPAMVLILDGNS